MGVGVGLAAAGRFVAFGVAVGFAAGVGVGVAAGVWAGAAEGTAVEAPPAVGLDGAKTGVGENRRPGKAPPSPAAPSGAALLPGKRPGRPGTLLPGCATAVEEGEGEGESAAAGANQAEGSGPRVSRR